MERLLKRAVTVLVLTIVAMFTVSTVTVQAASYKSGSWNKNVIYLQQNLNFLGYPAGVIDGIYGAKTEKAVSAMQETLGISVPDDELDALIRDIVEDIQRYLVAKGYLKGTVDGVKGSVTGKAFKELEVALGYAETGIVSKDVLKAIVNDSSVNVEIETLEKWAECLGIKRDEVIPPIKEDTNKNNENVSGTDDKSQENEEQSSGQMIVAIEGIDRTELNAIKARYENHGHYLKKNYKYNTVEIVTDLQRLLNAENGYKELEVNGKFDSNTYKAVRNFQERYGLGADGIAGDKTWNKLFEIVNARIENIENNGLDINAMLDYAKLHWSNYNTAEYRSYKNADTDCCNFVSQLLCAGGLKETDAWHGSKEYGNITDTFDFIPDFIKYMRNNCNIEYYTNNKNLIEDCPNEYDRKSFSIDDIEVGDCITYKGDRGRDHIMYVIGVNKKSKVVYYTAHTTDRYYGIGKAGYMSLFTSGGEWYIEGVLKTSDIRVAK